MKKIIFFILFSCVFCNTKSLINSGPVINYLSDQEYITGDDGVIRMYINILGHIKKPGTYLLYDGVDIMSAFSIAGGYMDGANLKKITIYSKDGTKKTVNLKDSFNSSIAFKDLVNLKPLDTIYIEQKAMAKFWLNSNLPAVLLGILNIALTIERTD